MNTTATAGGLSVRVATARAIDVAALATYHTRIDGGVRWRLTSTGVDVLGQGVRRTAGRPATVASIWRTHRDAILRASKLTGVPVELIIATAATESRGNPSAVRKEPGYTSDAKTPARVSPGIMQTLISTARSTLGNKAVGRAWLLDPANSILAGAAYIAEQAPKTLLDPPVVFAAYNSGGVYAQRGAKNRWKMRQYPIGTGEHCDRAILWLNDCFAMFAETGDAPAGSLYALTRAHAGVTDAPPPAPPPPPAPTGGKGGTIGKTAAGVILAALAALAAWIFGGTGQ